MGTLYNLKNVKKKTFIIFNINKTHFISNYHIYCFLIFKWNWNIVQLLNSNCFVMLNGMIRLYMIQETLFSLFLTGTRVI